MKIKEIISALESWAPLTDAEDFDNAGLLIGHEEDEISKVLITLDVTDEVLEEALNNNAEMIITFHPLIFSGLKKLSGKTRVEQLTRKAIQNNIAVYAIHTNLDAQENGVNSEICKRLGLKDNKILIQKENNLFKLVMYVPEKNAEKVKNAVYATGAGKIGDYEECSYNLHGFGTFKPVGDADPQVGEKYVQNRVPEARVEILLQSHQLNAAVSAMKKSHPYEEVAYEVIAIENKNQTKGMGQIGELEYPVAEEEFLELVKQNLQTECVRHSEITGRKIQKVAVLGGSGAFAVNVAKSAGADAFVTADLKYHDFFKAEGKILLCDPGHFESEQFTKNLIANYLSEIFPNFAVLISEINTNPINYYL